MAYGSKQINHVETLESAAQNVNLAVLTLKKYARDRSKIALVWESVAGKCETHTYFDLEWFSNRIASVFREFGIGYNVE